MPQRAHPSTGPDRFGRGYAIGFFIFLGVTIASFIALIVAKDDVARIRALGFIMMSFGGGFTFAIIYTIVMNKGVPWAVSIFSYHRSGVLTRQQHPLGFWSFAVMMLLLFSLLIGSGAWLCANPAAVDAALEPYKT